MYLILEVMMIIGYLFNGWIGMGIAILMYGLIWVDKKNTIFERIIISLIFSVPVFQIGFAGQHMHHMFSWTMIFMLVLIGYLLVNIWKKRIKITYPVLVVSSIVAILLVLNVLVNDYKMESIIELIQILLMIVPIVISIEGKEYLKTQINQENKGLYLSYINITILATIIGVLIQYIGYKNFDTILGNMTLFVRRTTHDLFFKGYSVLSAYLGIGIVMNVKSIIDKFELRKALFIILCFIGIIINTSRTGLLASIIISALIIVSNIKNIKNMIKTKNNLIIIIICIIVFILVATYSVIKIAANRQLTKALDDNGRIETYLYGADVMTDSLKNFFIGAGLAKENYLMTPHNFIFENIMKMGIIVSGILFTMLIKFLKYINDSNNDFKYIIWQMLLSCMFITAIFALSFITIYMIMAVIFSENERIKNGEYKSISDNGNT